MIMFLRILYDNLCSCIIHEKKVCLQRYVIKITFNSTYYLLYHFISILSLLHIITFILSYISVFFTDFFSLLIFYFGSFSPPHADQPHH